jgi:potassium efflux system protein
MPSVRSGVIQDPFCRSTKQPQSAVSERLLAFCRQGKDKLLDRGQKVAATVAVMSAHRPFDELRACAVLFVLLLPALGSAQNPLVQLIDAGSREPSSERTAPAVEETRAEIVAALSQARAQLSSLETDEQEATGPPAATPASGTLEQTTRLVRVLEQRLEAQAQLEALQAGRSAIESGLARDPSEVVGDPPPFPVPVLDGVTEAWQRANAQLEEHRGVLDDRRANLELAGERTRELDRERRRLRDRIEKEDEDPTARIELEITLRDTADELQIARQQEALARQRAETTRLEHEIRTASARQAQAALDWVRSQLSPRESDLTVTLERVERERLELERTLTVARSRLDAAESALHKAEERALPGDESAYAEHAAELRARRARLPIRQRIVALLGERLERLDRTRSAWQQRYAVLGRGFDAIKAPSWRSDSERELERLSRLRRIHESELAQADLSARQLRDPEADSHQAAPNARRVLQAELEDLAELARIYRADITSLEESIRLEERLRAELTARMKKRDLEERLRSLGALALAFWSYELTTSADSPITPGKIVVALIVFIVGLSISRLIRARLRTSLFPRFGFDHGASSAFASLTFYGLTAITFLLALRAVNIPLTGFAVAGGALAIGLGFGSQTLISNFISGLLILAERPIRPGDLVEVGGVIGTIDEIGMRSTRIRTPDNFHIIVPNASFLESNVVNWTHEDPMIRLRVQVGVAYGSPTREVEALLLQAAREHPRCLNRPEPAAIFSDFGDSALVFEVRFWIRYDEQTDRSVLQSDVRYRIDELFREHDIVIAFPQMDVHLDVVDRGSEA